MKRKLNKAINRYGKLFSSLVEKLMENSLWKIIRNSNLLLEKRLVFMFVYMNPYRNKSRFWRRRFRFNSNVRPSSLDIICCGEHFFSLPEQHRGNWRIMKVIVHVRFYFWPHELEVKVIFLRWWGTGWMVVFRRVASSALVGN